MKLRSYYLVSDSEVRFGEAGRCGSTAIGSVESSHLTGSSSRLSVSGVRGMSHAVKAERLVRISDAKA